MDIISQTGQNKSIPLDMLCFAMHISRATYYRHLRRVNWPKDRELPSKAPVNALNSHEKQCVLDLLHSERFIDKTPYDVYFELIILLLTSYNVSYFGRAR